MLSTAFKAQPTVRHLLSRTLFVLALLVGAHLPAAQPAAGREYQLKAVFLFNFAQFVEWPATAFADTTVPLVIGVLGEDPFGHFLDDVIKGESVNGRPLVIQRYRNVEEIERCHILYIAKSETARLAPTVNHLRGRPVLTVSDIEGSAPVGVMIRLLEENKKIRLRINLEAARRAGLVFSSKLLRPAEIINEPEGSAP